MRQQSREVLAVQLHESLSAHREGSGEPFEIAVLAGLLIRTIGAERTASEDLSLTEARQLGDSGVLLAALPPNETADDILDRLCSMSDEDGEDELADLLMDLDELCAGLSFLAQADRCRQAAEDAAGVIRAFPEPFRPLAGWASRILAYEPPTRDDPARLFWMALEASQFPAQVVHVPACDEARKKLRIPLVVCRSQIGSQPPALLAASELPVPPTLFPLAQGPGYELGLGQLADGQPALLMTSSSPVKLLHNGSPVALVQLGPDFHRAPAAVGQYELQIGDQAVSFEVVD